MLVLTVMHSTALLTAHTAHFSFGEGQSWVMVAGEEEQSQSQEHSEERPPVKRRKLAEPEAVVNFNTGVLHTHTHTPRTHIECILLGHTLFTCRGIPH